MKEFVPRRAIAIARKEIYHIMRDPFTLGMALWLPIFMVIFFGAAIEFNVKNIHTIINDASKTQTSRQLIEAMGSSEYFLLNYTDSPSYAIDMLTAENARAALMIPPSFERDLLAGRSAKAQILLDGSDSSTVGPVLGYINGIQMIASKKIANYEQNLPYEIRTRYLFNPELNSAWFVVPGLNVLIMGILSIVLTSLTIAREYENGSMELLLTTPVQPLEIIVGKLAPYGILGVMALTLIYFVARLAFKLPFVGSHFLFYLGACLFLIAYLGQGLLISVTTRNQQIAVQLSMLTGLMPTQLLSGFVFPIESMPQVMQYFTAILPARWFMEISRVSYLQHTSFNYMWQPFLVLTIFCIIVLLLGTKKFKRDLEP